MIYTDKYKSHKVDKYYIHCYLLDLSVYFFNIYIFAYIKQYQFCYQQQCCSQNLGSRGVEPCK